MMLQLGALSCDPAPMPSSSCVRRSAAARRCWRRRKDWLRLGVDSDPSARVPSVLLAGGHSGRIASSESKGIAATDCGSGFTAHADACTATVAVQEVASEASDLRSLAVRNDALLRPPPPRLRLGEAPRGSSAPAAVVAVLPRMHTAVAPFAVVRAAVLMGVAPAASELDAPALPTPSAGCSALRSLADRKEALRRFRERKL
mmetsp:Transcript_7885/g.20624  ORF Transcript_7885/g.20624 Transcript_7885/m.20624 type:complete len:202 (+) Transcript_7885:332-937(+)